MRIPPVSNSFFRNLASLIEYGRLESEVTLEQASFASRANLSPLLFYYLKRSQLLNSLDERVKRGLYRDFVMAGADYLFTGEQVTYLNNFFNQIQVPVMAFKGIYTRRFYPDPLLRLMGDYDFLIKGEDRVRLSNKMLENGFVIVKTGRNFLERIGAEITFRGPDKWKLIDIHYRLFQRFRYTLDESEIWKRAHRVNEFFFYPSPEDQFVITVIHLIKDAFTLPLSGLMDLYYLYMSNLDMDYIEFQVKKAGVERGFSTVVYLMNELLGVNVKTKITGRIFDIEFFREEKFSGFQRYSYALSTIGKPLNKILFTGAYLVLGGIDLVSEK